MPTPLPQWRPHRQSEAPAYLAECGAPSGIWLAGPQADSRIRLKVTCR
jgi:hypothetical protein